MTLGLNLRSGTRWTIDLRGNESQAEAQSSWAPAGQASSSGCDLEPMTSYLFPAAGTCNALVRFSIGGVGQVVTGREGTRRQRQFQFVESTAWKAGAHTVRFGVDYRRMVPIRRDAAGVLSAIADDITSLTDKKNLWLGSSPAISAATEVTELSLWAISSSAAPFSARFAPCRTTAADRSARPSPPPRWKCWAWIRCPKPATISRW